MSQSNPQLEELQMLLGEARRTLSERKTGWEKVLQHRKDQGASDKELAVQEEEFHERIKKMDRICDVLEMAVMGAGEAGSGVAEAARWPTGGRVHLPLAESTRGRRPMEPAVLVSSGRESADLRESDVTERSHASSTSVCRRGRSGRRIPCPSPYLYRPM